MMHCVVHDTVLYGRARMLYCTLYERTSAFPTATAGACRMTRNIVSNTKVILMTTQMWGSRRNRRQQSGPIISVTLLTDRSPSSPGSSRSGEKLELPDHVHVWPGTQRGASGLSFSDIGPLTSARYKLAWSAGCGSSAPAPIRIF
jgi:hypothetical protein